MNYEHAERTSKREQTKHDEIIVNLEAKLSGMGKLANTNPSKSKENAVRRDDKIYYPDVYVYENNKVIEVYEVETSETVTDEAAKQQWKFFGDGKAGFFLVVPEKDLDKAKELSKKYEVDVQGYLTFS